MTERLSPAPHFSRTARTWEVELLISGVAVFAMLQLPGWLDDAMFALEPRLDGQWFPMLLMGYIYSKSAAVVLAGTFLVHLLLRAHWIALMGVHSVFPGGMKPSTSRIGPVQRALDAESQVQPQELIEAADNRASIVFAIGVTVALLLVSICIAFCGALLVAILAIKALHLQTDPLLVVATLGIGLFLPYFAAALIDSAIGRRLQPESRTYALLHRVMTFYQRLGFSRRNNAVIAIIASQRGEWRMVAIMFGVFVPVLLGVAGSYTAMRLNLPLGSYELFPAARALRLDATHYDDQRDPTRAGALPYIDSMVVEGPYLRLVIPYEPRRDIPLLRSCTLPANGNDAQVAQARLGCLQVQRKVQLDGKPIDGLHFDAATDPRTGRPALLAMIDVRALANGRHELLVARPPVPDSRRDRRDPDYRNYRIVFWR